VDRALARLRSTPGVEFAAITDNMPLAGENSVYSVYREDNPLPESAVPTANLRNITPDYFAAMQIPLVAGEDFGNKEREHPEDAIVSQKLAKAAWPAENPLGRKFRINGRTYTVAGIAADARIVNLKQSVPVVYLPYWHDPSPNVFFLVRSSLPVETLGPSVRSCGTPTPKWRFPLSSLSIVRYQNPWLRTGFRLSFCRVSVWPR
jgi:hypothetical protein